MIHVKKNSPSGVINIHAPFSHSLLKSEQHMADVKDTTERERRKSLSPPSVRTSREESVRPGRRNEASPSGPKHGSQKDQFSHTSLRQLQAKLEAENQQAQQILQPLLETENNFMKELESFLSQRDVTELRRRELLHKHWTEKVWVPLQRRVEERVSGCSSVEAKRRQSLYTHYLHHCNSKGFVFLETYDLREYNPFLLNIKKPHYYKLKTSDSKEPSYLQLHRSLKDERTSPSCGAGYKNTWRKAEELIQSDCPLYEGVTSQADKLPQASFHRSASAPTQIPVEGERKPSRLDTIPHHITASASSDGRCHQSSCWFSRCGSRQ